MKPRIGQPPTPAVEAASAAPPAGTPKPAATAVNLIQLLDTRRAPTSGTWSMTLEGTVSCSKTGDYSRVKIKYEPGPEYDLHAVFRRESKDGDFGILIDHGGKQGLLQISAQGNTIAGLCGYDGKDTADNSTRTPFAVESNRDYNLVVEVREASIRVVIDGKELFKCAMAGHDLSIDEITTGLGDPKSLGLNSHQCLVLFKKIELTEMHAK